MTYFCVYSCMQALFANVHFRKLPDEFKTQQSMECFGYSQSAASRNLIRMMEDMTGRFL